MPIDNRRPLFGDPDIYNLTLSDDQQDALEDILTFLAQPEAGELALSGPAGTGKTMLTKFILHEARGGAKYRMAKLLFGTKDDELQIELCSSTNKAATVLANATGEEVNTIHNLLGLVVKNDYKTGATKVVKTKKTSVITNTFIIIDEASMINADLLHTIRACTSECKVLYIGDSYQLAPVFENASPVFTQIKDQLKLTTIQRQVADSPIIQYAGQFRDALDTGIFPKIESHGSTIMHLDANDFEDQLVKSFSHASHPTSANQLSTNGLDKVVCWSNNRVHQYNSYIRSMHTSNPDYETGEFLITNSAILSNQKRFFKGDQLVEVLNVTLASVDGLDGWEMKIKSGSKSLTVFQPQDMKQLDAVLKYFAKEKDWKNYFKYKEYCVDLRVFYASTVNKAQGSTYKDVFIDVGDIGKNKKSSEIARLMYTALTRASNNVYLRGELPPRLYKNGNSNQQIPSTITKT